MSKTISALPRLLPTMIVSTSTGEVCSWDDFSSKSLTPLLEWVLADAQRLYDTNPIQVQEDAANLKGSANSYSRSKGYKPAHLDLPREVKAKSRLGELVHHKLMTETASYVRNPNPHKQPHSFSGSVNLGAVDSQMVRLERDDNTLHLTWKCWDEEYLLIFAIPHYVLKRDITKWSLPVVSGKGFVFTIQESPIPIKSNLIAGIDLGRVEPFTAVVLNEKQKLVAEYRSRPQLRASNSKRERILQEVVSVRKKADARKSLGLDNSIQRENIKRLRSKSSRMGDSLKNEISADILRKTNKHKVSILYIEDLKWVTGKKYGSKWVHGAISNKIEHTAARHGVRVKRISPRGSSQHCCKCENPIVHNTKTRTVWCGECKSNLDRDFNAAMNIALKKAYPNNAHRRIGDTCSSIFEQRVVLSVPGSRKSFDAFCSCC